MVNFIYIRSEDNSWITIPGIYANQFYNAETESNTIEATTTNGLACNMPVSCNRYIPFYRYFRLSDGVVFQRLTVQLMLLGRTWMSAMNNEGVTYNIYKIDDVARKFVMIKNNTMSNQDNMTLAGAYTLDVALAERVD